MALKFIPPISIDYEKLERISEISSQISDLRKKISKVEEIKDSLENYKEKINNEIENWTSKHAEYSQLDLAPQIYIKNKFEGIVAEQLAIDFPLYEDEIVKYATQISAIPCGIDDQISKINEYIDQLNEEIKSLQKELNAL